MLYKNFQFKYKKKSLIGIERLQIFPKYKEYKVDFFYNDSVASFITIDFNGKQLKVHNPLEVMDYKLNMAINTKVYSVTSRKHNEDLTQIFGQMSWQLVQFCLSLFYGKVPQLSLYIPSTSKERYS